MATTWAKSVSTDARKPDQIVYISTPAAIISTPWMKLIGESIAMSAPPAMKLDMSEMTLPSTLEIASISWLDRPWRARMTSARVCACGATARIRRPKG